MMKPVTPVVPVSWGELLDKISVLQIKRARIASPEALRNVEKEHRLLGAIAAAAIEWVEIAALFEDLRHVNEALWDIEDAIREEEATAHFGAEFVELARSVYKLNDERAAIKRRINTLMHSELVEEKSYAGLAEGKMPARSGVSSIAGAGAAAR